MIYTQNPRKVWYVQYKGYLYSFGHAFQNFSGTITNVQREKLEMSKVLYTNTIESIMYAMVCTRPDIAPSMSIVSRIHGESRKESLAYSEVDIKISQGNVGS